MTQKLGKLDRALMKTVYRSLGSRNSRVLVGPENGFDNAIISVGEDTVMAITTDPVSLLPQIGARMSSWLSVHLIASDMTTSGIAPQFASFSLNFPPETETKTMEEYLRGLGTACGELGIAIISGHTGTYEGANFGVIGGGTLFGLGKSGRYVTPAMARVGDAIVMTKHAAIEATAYLSTSFPRYTEERVGPEQALRARRSLGSCSTVKDAETAATFRLGKTGVTSMHDATEGGVFGAMSEMASASGHAMVVGKESIPITVEAREVCSAFGIDPLTSLSEGALLLTCNPDAVDGLIRAMRRQEIEVRRIGSVQKGSGLWVSTGGGAPKRKKQVIDGYWKAYAESEALGRM